MVSICQGFELFQDRVVACTPINSFQATARRFEGLKKRIEPRIFCVSFWFGDDRSVLVEEFGHGAVVSRQEIIWVCWRVEEKGGRFKVEFECIKVDGADAAE